MLTTNDGGQELGEQYIEQLPKLPGFHLDSAVPCLCSIEAITTSKRRGYSDLMAGNQFTSFIEG